RGSAQEHNQEERSASESETWRSHGSVDDSGLRGATQSTGQAAVPLRYRSHESHASKPDLAVRRRRGRLPHQRGRDFHLYGWPGGPWRLSPETASISPGIRHRVLVSGFHGWPAGPWRLLSVAALK